MILHTLPPATPLFRAYTPRWAFDPLSGAGAATAGGRFNRPGRPALYLALELATAVAEYRQSSPFAPPFTMITFLAELPPLVDVRQLSGEWDQLWNDWACDWRVDMLNGNEPPSWVLGDLVCEAGHAGILFPSKVEHGGTNLVLFTDMVPTPDVLHVHDPDGHLPMDPSSWNAETDR